ncbi:MAG: cupin domain-containing protein [Burkholderiales bacterium]
MKATTFVFVAGCIAASTAWGQEDKRLVRLAPDEIKTPQSATTQAGTSGVGGLQMGVLSGSPKQAGLYTVFLKLGPNSKIQPHAHPDDRVGIVVSGTFYFAHGDTFDETKLKALPAGSFYTEPPGANHFAMTKDESVTIYVTGTGPTGTVYVNPADDPSKK